MARMMSKKLNFQQQNSYEDIFITENKNESGL